MRYRLGKKKGTLIDKTEVWKLKSQTERSLNTITSKYTAKTDIQSACAKYSPIHQSHRPPFPPLFTLFWPLSDPISLSLTPPNDLRNQIGSGTRFRGVPRKTIQGTAPLGTGHRTALFQAQRAPGARLELGTLGIAYYVGGRHTRAVFRSIGNIQDRRIPSRYKLLIPRRLRGPWLSLHRDDIAPNSAQA